MSATKEDISVVLDLDTNKFEVRLKKSGDLLRRFDADLIKAGKSIERTEKRVTGITASMRDWVLIIGQARNAFNQISFLTYDWAAAIVRSNAESERMTYLIKGLSNEVTELERLEDAKKTVSDLFDLAGNAPFKVNALTDTFVKFKSVGLDPTNGSMQALVDATAAFGGTDETLHRASIAIQQMAGKGVISMEELRQQLGEAVPQAINLMARSMGVSYAELVKEIAKGTVEARPAIKSMLEEFERTFGGRAQELMESFSGQYAKMVTNIRKLTSQNAGIAGFFEEVKTQLRDLNEWLESPSAANWATTVGQSLERVVEVLRAGVDWFTRYQSVIVTAGKAFLVYWGANKIASVVTGVYSLGRALTTQIALWKTLRSSTMQASLAAVQAKAGFTGAAGAVSSLSIAGTGAVGMLKLLGRGFVSVLGPIGFAVSAIWTLVDVLNVFKSKHREVLDGIIEGQEIANAAERQSVEQALEEEGARLTNLIEARNEAAARLEDAKEELARMEDNENVFGANGMARQADLISRMEQQLAEMNDEVDRSSESFQRVAERAGGALETFDEYQTGKIAQEMTSAMDEVERKIRDKYNQDQIGVVDDEEMSQEQKAKELANRQKSYYETMLNEWRGFVTEHEQIMKESLENGDTRTAEAAKRAIADARQRIVDLNRTQSELGGMGIPTLETDEPTGTEKTAMKSFNKLFEDLKRESEGLAAAVRDPFAYQIPDSIGKTEQKLRDLAERAPQLAGQIDDALNMVKANESAAALIELEKAERSYANGAVSASKRRERAREEEIATYENQRSALKKLGMWSEEHERRHQRIISNINRKTVEDVEATLEDRRDAYEQNQIDILSDETLSHDERTKALLSAEKTYYNDAISVWQEFMAAQNIALAEAISNGDQVAVAIIQNSLATARAALAGVFSDLRTTEFNIGGGSGGASKAEGAIERFNELLRDTKREAKEAARALADPFAYEIPDSITDTKDKLDDLVKDAPQLKSRMDEVLNTVRQTEMTNVLIELRDTQREITREIAGTAQARKMDEEEEIKRLENMKARLIEFGLWSKEHEKELQESLRLIRERGFNETPLGSFSNEWKNTFEDMESNAVEAIRSVGDAVTDMVMTGKADLDSLRESILRSTISTGVNTGLSALVSAVGLPSFGDVSTTASVNHSGGMVGASGGRTRNVPLGLFENAKRFHTGGIIGSNEQPIIAEDGEGVFTREQMRAIGANMNKAPSVKINLINNSGIGIEEPEISTRLDAETLVTDIVLKKVSQPGAFRDAMKG